LSEKKISAIHCKKNCISQGTVYGHEEEGEEEGKLTFEERIFI
jgi:hypothetical protein